MITFSDSPIVGIGTVAPTFIDFPGVWAAGVTVCTDGATALAGVAIEKSAATKAETVNRLANFFTVNFLEVVSCPFLLP